MFFFFFQAEDGIRDLIVTGVQTCALPISLSPAGRAGAVRPGLLPRQLPAAGDRARSGRVDGGVSRAWGADTGRDRGGATAAPRRRIPGPPGVRLRDERDVLRRVRRRRRGGADGDRLHRADDASSTHLARPRVRGRDGDGGTAPVAP